MLAVDDFQIFCFCHNPQMLDLKRYVPLEHCRLVKYDRFSKTLEQSFEEQEVGEENVIRHSCVAELYLMNYVKSLLGQLLHYM